MIESSSQTKAFEYHKPQATQDILTVTRPKLLLTLGAGKVQSIGLELAEGIVSALG